MDQIQKTNIRLQTWVVIVGTLIMGAKLVAYLLTNSNTILTDVLESVINILAGAFALYSLYYSSRPKDESHPYGHGKIEFLSSGLEGSMILIAGVLMLGKGGYGLFAPPEISRLDTGILLTAVGGFLNYGLGWMLEKQGKKSHSIILEADGKHLKSDAYSTAAMIIGLGIVFFTGLIWLDSLIAMVFGLLLIITGWKLVRRSVAGIMDEADYELVEELVEILEKNRKPEWIDIHNFRVIKYGNKLHVDCHLTLPWYLDLKKAHDEIKAVEDMVNAAYERKVEFFIHNDPCVQDSCSICTVTDCKVRIKPFEKKMKWDLQSVTKNVKHSNNKKRK